MAVMSSLSMRARHAAFSVVANRVTGSHLRRLGLAIPSALGARQDLLDLAITQMQSERPLYLEFGVHRGYSIKYWADRLLQGSARFVGFDSFEGLPEDWTRGIPRGHFSTGGRLPDLADARVTFVPGWFEKTLPKFAVPEHDRMCINVDADLYGSAVTVLRWATPHWSIGDLLYFDEFNDWRAEGRAFREWLLASGYRVELLGVTGSFREVLFRRVA